jgi:hypothetical protein
MMIDSPWISSSSLFLKHVLYIGLDRTSFWDAWFERSTLCFHLGIVRVELVCRHWSDGPTKTASNEPTDRAAAQGHPTDAVA